MAPEDRPDDREAEEAAPRVPVMLPSTPEEASRAERLVAETPAPPGVSEARLKELKEKARAEIDKRLKERRKKRLLMRGSDSGRHLP
jgi:hypothetical protein